MKTPAIFLAGLAAAACSSVPIELRPPDPLVATALPASEFPGAPRLLAGFDARTPETRWNGGDRILFGLRLRKGDTTKRWLLQLEVIVGDRMRSVLDGEEVELTIFEERQWSYTAVIGGERKQIAIDSKMSLVEVKVHDEDGTVLGKSLVRLPAELMSRGLLPGIECALAHQDGGGDFRSFGSVEEVRPMAEGLISLIALLDVVQNDSVLEEYFWQVVQKPSVWSVIAGFGVTASLTASLEKSVLVRELPPGLPAAGQAYAMPLRVDVNGDPALVADVISVDAQRPFALCGGIVAASARHPGDEGLRFDVQLLAARLGELARSRGQYR